MTVEPTTLEAILESIADGASLETISELGERLPADERRLLPHLHLVASISEHHRSIQDDDRLDDRWFVPRAPLTAGSRWGKLELLDKVGERAFGEVLRARDIHLDAEFALKLLHADRWTDGITAHLLDEGRALARLRHPHVIRIHSTETHDGHVGLRMEFVRGRTLESLLNAQGPFSASEAAAIGVHLCRALAAVHLAGLLHRDIKAQNVMREEGGRIVLMDLGSGQVASDRSSGRLVGTPLYLAPEILRGEYASPHSDIYSVGVLLYHLVTGEYPYRAKTWAQLTELHQSGRATLLQDARPDLPEGFVRVVDRALARRPEDRFDSAGAMGHALTHVEFESGHRWYQPRWRMVLLAAVFVSVVAIAAGLFWKRAGIVRPGAVDRLAVLGFTTIGSDSELELLARGIPMEVTASLGQIGAVKVVPWAFMRRFQPDTALQIIADGTQADAIVEGTIQRASAADKAALSVSVQVFRATTGTMLWSQTFQTRTGGVIALQAEIARRIAGGLRIVLARREQLLLGRFRNVPDEAVELYLKGREQYETYEQNFSGAIGYFVKVLEIDPTFADAHAALAECYALQSSFSASAAAGEAYARATASAERAIAINPELSEAYSARGFAKAFQGWDLAGAEPDFRRALELDPHSASAHGAYSNYLTVVDRHEEAIEQSRVAEERAPLSPLASRRVGWAYFMARRYHEAIEQLRRVLDMDPSYDPARTLLARAYAMVGWYDDAIREIEPVPKDFEAIAAQVYAQAGRSGRALELLEIAMVPHNTGNPPYQIALAFAALDDREQTLRWLTEARRVHDPGLVHLHQDPRFDRLRDDPRFKTFEGSLHIQRP